ncbi:uncharacterized protein LOC143268307 [Peromyscus maniculatus bairdii]|uniref:uncharacterized protein LOC143268307 n=1 Tax=Peromyscus maniculatus bairdii TaxID=230844 RepID=UPI003FD4C69F
MQMHGEKPKRKQIRFQPAARCCLPPLLSTRRRDCCPPGSVPKGVVLEGRCRGGRLTVRGLETSFSERRRHPATSTRAAGEAAAAFSTWLERIRVDSTIHRLPAHCTFSPLKPQHTDTRHSCLLTRIRGALHYKPLKEMPRWKLSKR